MCKVKKIMTHIPKRIGNDETRITLYDKLHLKMISIMHDSLYRLFVNPRKLLKAAGLSDGQRVLEIGFGPGFFTTPAAEIIGTGGHLYSIDINPAAVAGVRRKVEQVGLKNVSVLVADASKINLLDSSVDMAFLFGVIRSLKNLDSVLAEMHRVLKENGTIAVQKTSWSEKKLLASFKSSGRFRYLGKDSRIYKFEKSSLRES